MAEALSQVQLPFQPHAHQRYAHTLKLAVRFLVLVWHRRAGKTVFAIVELILAALASKRSRSRYGYVAPLLKQAKAIAWDYLKHFTSTIPGVIYNESELSAELPNGARIRLFGADNPDGFRGLYFDGVILDEVADMKASVWGEIIRPALADRQGWAIFIGTPKGINLFSEIYFNAAKGLDGWGADLKRASETGVIPTAELEQARASMSRPQFSQEFECDFSSAAENVLLELGDALAAKGRGITEVEFVDEPKVLGVDVARFGSDRTVFAPRQGRACFNLKTFRGLNTMEVAGRVVNAIEKWQPDMVFVDVTGLGAGVVDRLLELGHLVIGIESAGKPGGADPKCLNQRAWMWSQMARWVKGGGCIPDDNELVAELSTPTYTYDSSGRMKLESKDDIKKRGLSSPDKADALALTFAMQVARRGAEENLPGSSWGRRCVTEYDPFERRD